VEPGDFGDFCNPTDAYPLGTVAAGDVVLTGTLDPGSDVETIRFTAGVSGVWTIEVDCFGNGDVTLQTSITDVSCLGLNSAYGGDTQSFTGSLSSSNSYYLFVMGVDLDRPVPYRLILRAPVPTPTRTPTNLGGLTSTPTSTFTSTRTHTSTWTATPTGTLPTSTATSSPTFTPTCGIWYLDIDGDGYGLGSPSTFCSNPGSTYANNNFDCNDLDASIHPGVTDVCGNTVDEDCNGVDCAGNFIKALFTHGGTGVDTNSAGMTTSIEVLLKVGVDPWATASVTLSSAACTLTVPYQGTTVVGGSSWALYGNNGFCAPAAYVAGAPLTLSVNTPGGSSWAAFTSGGISIVDNGDQIVWGGTGPGATKSLTLVDTLMSQTLLDLDGNLGSPFPLFTNGALDLRNDCSENDYALSLQVDSFFYSFSNAVNGSSVQTRTKLDRSFSRGPNYPPGPPNCP